VGSDLIAFISSSVYRGFNPRPPSGERLFIMPFHFPISRFQSTPPEWGATTMLRVGPHLRKCFNPRPPSGERPPSSLNLNNPRGFQSTPPEWGATILLHTTGAYFDVSIHAPRVGSDFFFCHKNMIELVSIHAPRVGSDGYINAIASSTERFNPRPPSGERLAGVVKTIWSFGFQSTPPEWGATSTT